MLNDNRKQNGLIHLWRKIAYVSITGAILFGVGMLTGCQKEGTTESESEELTRPEDAKAEESAMSLTTAESVVWAHEPDLLLDSVRELVTDNLNDEFNTWMEEFTGYPQEWDYTQSTPYTRDAILIVKDGNDGIADYSGNVLFEPSVREERDEFGFLRNGIMYRSDMGMYYYDYTKKYESKMYGTLDFETRRFTENFLTTAAVEPPGGIGGDPGPWLSNLNGELVLAAPDYVQPISELTMQMMRNKEGSYNALIQMVDSSGKEIGYSLYDDAWNHRFDFPDLYIQEFYFTKFVNGFCVFSNQPNGAFSNGKYENNGKRALFNMTTGEPVTDFVYDDAKWFEEGFCPVKKGNKWGFIDETGTEVTDFIFDDASTLYQGKAYVGVNGIYGVLDLKATLENGTPVTADTCYKGMDLKPTTTAEENTESVAATTIGSITVKVNKLNIRTKPGTDGEKTGQANTGDTFSVFETKENEGYTWYRISDNQWVADKDQDWVTFESN